MNYTAKIRKNKGLITGVTSKDQTRLLESPLLNPLTPVLQNDLLRTGAIHSLKKGELLFMAGDSVDSIYYLLSGKLKEYYSTEAGEVCLRRILIPGSYISLHLIFTQQQTYSYTCEAVKHSRYFTWKTKEFWKILMQEPSLGLQVAAVLSCYIENSCRLHCLCRKTQAVPRVAGYLLRQCNPILQNSLCSCKNKPYFQANLRPLELSANNLCLARETFSRALSSLQEKHFIRMKNGVVDIIDPDALKRISGIK